MAWPFGLDPDAGSGIRAAGRTELTDLTAQERRLAALAAGDIAAAAEGITETACLFLPCFDPADKRLEVLVSGRAAYQEYLRALLELYEIKRITPASILVRERYLFSENTLELAARGNGAPLQAGVGYALAEIFSRGG